jgi:RNA polymerase sigma-70 factor (ECF subfamily)
MTMDTSQGTYSPGSTNSSLLRRARDRQPEAWRQLVELYGPLVYGWCRAARLQPADAADVVQEVFAALTRSLTTFKPQETGSFRAWLRAITGHKTSDHLRRGRQHAHNLALAGGNTALFRDLPSADDPLPAESAPVQEQAVLVHAALEILRGEIRAQTWQAFWRTTIDDQSPADVAADLGMRLGAVYQAKSRTVIRLREIMAELDSTHGNRESRESPRYRGDPSPQSD